MVKYLSREQTGLVLNNIRVSGLPFTYDLEKHRIEVKLTESESFSLRLPITILNPANIDHKVNYIIVLIQSGSSSVGYFEDGVNLSHKVFSSYMVRMKQGKSQIKYLKTKGKSRAGSRVRLGESLEFFENINARLQDYFSSHRVDRIAISCSKILIPYFYNSKVSCPFEKNDPRLYKIPKHVHLPKHEVLVDINKYLLKGELIFKEEVSDLLKEILGE